MTDYRETLRLKGQGISQGSIAVSYGGSRNIVDNVFKRTEQLQRRMRVIQVVSRIPTPSLSTDVDLQLSLYQNLTYFTN